MAELRWLLLAVGIVVLAGVFWLSRRESRGERLLPDKLLRSRERSEPALEPEQPAVQEVQEEKPSPSVERVVAIRLMAREHGGFPGEKLLLALREEGLRHGRFNIFHFYGDGDLELFSVASLVEPGSFDLARMRDSFYPGVSLFLMLPSPVDALSAFDQMLSTARELARRLDGDLLDEQGSRLSVQRERYLREEVIQFQHNSSPS